MFELEFIPQKKTESVTDSLRIMNAALNSSDSELRSCAQECKDGYSRLLIDRKFVDARHGRAKLIYRFDFLDNEDYEVRNKRILKSAFPYAEQVKNIAGKSIRPVVVGEGPAGLFAGLVLAKYGLKPIIIERGTIMEERVRDTEAFKSGKSKIKSNSNIQFGEGGAGTFSDGKLYTGVTSDLKDFISRILVIHGAPGDILYDTHPHVGTDYLRQAVVGIRNDIKSLGGEVWFNTVFEGYKTDENGCLVSARISNADGERDLLCNRLILAIGHSSRDTFRMLYNSGCRLESKPFSVGVRIEHLRSEIDISQYGIDTATTADLSAANYKLSCNTKTGRKLYTFCMCPGGEVIASQCDQESVCTNGMSYRARNGMNSNSALLVPVDSRDYGEGVLSGMNFQEELEHLAFLAGGATGKAPVTRYGDLCGQKRTEQFSKINPTYKPGVKPVDFSRIFPAPILETIKDGIAIMGSKIKGFDSPDSVLTAVESRSSSPVRILRDHTTYESLNVKGLFPCGEGAGYAGGIMSSAIDGINCANALISSLI